MRLWSPVCECWLRTQPLFGSGEQKTNISMLILNVFLAVGQQSLCSLPACWLGDNSWHGHLLFQHSVWLPSLVLVKERQTEWNKKNQPCKSIELRNDYLSIVLPKWEFLLPLLGPGGKPTPLLTPTQKTHSAGSVPQGWLPSTNAANTQMINTNNTKNTMNNN